MARVVISALNATLGLLFVARGPAAIRTSPRAVLIALPSLAAGGGAIALASPLGEWSLLRESMFAVAGVGTIIAMISLGRCFAVFPSARGVVVRGPFRCVRHPAYLCELAMIAICARSGWGAVVAVAAAAAIVVRVRAEEQVLRRLPRYRAYVRAVRWRMLPGIW